MLEYEKPKERNLGDLSCGHNSSLKSKSPHGESYNFAFNSPTFLSFLTRAHFGKLKQAGADLSKGQPQMRLRPRRN